MKITDLEPQIVWKYFDEITKVPRPSKKEEKIVAYLESFAQKNHIAYKKDEVGNIIMSKPATPGMENRETVVLQSHVDMVCEKNNGTQHDFEKDPIETIVDGEWLRANGTTLGADNGIGVAAELALLASDNIEHGPIECLFTIDEETGLTGAKALKAGFMTGNILLNLDSEDEGQIFMGCAGGKDTQALFHYQAEAAPADRQYFRIDVKGLNGGHSGGEIHKGLGNANKLLARFLFLLKKNKIDFLLCSIELGVQGAAISTSVCRGVAMTLLFIMLFKRLVPRIPLAYFRPFPFQKLKDVLKIGLPSAAEQISYDASQVTIVYFINMLGNEYLTARVYVMNIVIIGYIFSLSIAQATSICTGNLVGARKKQAAYLLSSPQTTVRKAGSM